jgi:hypothetical protein
VRPGRQQLRDQIAAVNVGVTRSARAAASKLELTAVCLVGTDKPIPRDFGDNRCGWPLRVVITKQARNAARKLDAHSPYHKFTVLESVNVPSRKHGDRLKLALDVCLLGEQQRQGNDTRPPRHKFRDVMGCWEDRSTRGLWWAALLTAATQECGVEVFDDVGRAQRILAKSRGAITSIKRREKAAR